MRFFRKKGLLIPIAYTIFLFVLLVTATSQAQLAKGANKFLGNITTRGQVRSDFLSLWNQITGENEHKWGSVEGTRDRMNWGGGDGIANFAKENNIPWKFHTLVWGSQYPKWMDGLSTTEQREEIIEWFDAAAAHYPDIPLIDVVNEAYMSDPNNWNGGKHAPIPFREALGGTGSTGFEWIVQSFKLARERWPNAILIYNDYNTLEWGNEINWIKQIIPKLVDAGAPIDAVGFQAHGLKGTSAATLKSRLDDIWNSIQLPMYITEYDIGEANDQTQLNNIRDHITVMWNHPKIVGITIWGYIDGSTWVANTGLIKNGQDRPSMTWLKSYIKDNLNPPNDYPDFQGGSGSSSYALSVSTKGRGTVTSSPDESSYEKDSKVTLTATASEGWVFSGWSGDASGKESPLSVTMDKRKSIVANFTTADGKEDLVLNGNFAAGADSWTFNSWGGQGSGTVANGEYQITVSTAGDNHYDLQVVQPGITLEKGKTYRLMFDASASANRSMVVNVGMPESPYTTFLSDIHTGSTDVNLTTSKQTFILDFTMTESTYDNSRVEFSVGLSNPTVKIDNVSLFEIPAIAVSLPGRSTKADRMIVRQIGNSVNVSFNNVHKSNSVLDVFNLKGNVVHSADFKTNTSFSAAGLPKGYYVVKVRSENLVHKSGFVLK